MWPKSGEGIWRAQLGEHIGQHAFLLHLLAALDRSLLSLDGLALRIQKSVLPNLDIVRHRRSVSWLHYVDRLRQATCRE